MKKLGKRLLEVPFVRKTLTELLVIPKKERDQIRKVIIEENPQNLAELVEILAREFGVIDSPAGGLENIPESGPVVIAANHRFGFKDGIKLLYEICKKRPNAKVLVRDNFKDFGVPEMEELFLFTKNEGKFSFSGFKQEYREMKEYLEKDGVLVIFPEVIVSRTNERGEIESKNWKKTFVQLAADTNATIVPTAVGGKLPGEFYEIKSMLSSKMSIPKMNFKHSGEVPVQFLSSESPKKVKRAEEKEKGIQNFADEVQTKVVNAVGVLDAEEPSAEEREKYLQYLEENKVMKIDGLRGNQVLYLLPSNNNFSKSDFAKYLIKERKYSFQVAGEATESELAEKIDPIEDSFYHPVLWDKKKGEIAMSYRVKPGSKSSIDELYNSDLFSFTKKFKDIKDETLELGRSFMNFRYLKSRKGLFSFLNMFIGLYATARYFQKEGIPIRYLMGSLSFSNKIEEKLRRELIASLQKKFPGKTGLANAKDPENLVTESTDRTFEEIEQSFPQAENYLLTFAKKYFELTTSKGATAGTAVSNPERKCDELLILFDLLHLNERSETNYRNGEDSIVDFLEENLKEG